VYSERPRLSLVHIHPRYRGTPSIFARAHDNVRHVDKVLEELTEREVLLSSTKEVLRGSRNSLVDVKYSLLPTMQFIREVKKANVRTAKLTEQLQRPVGKGLEE